MTEFPAMSSARRAIGLHTGFVQRRVPDWLHRSTASLPAWPPVMRWRRVSKTCRVLPNSRSRCLNRPCRNGSARTSMRCPCRRPAQSRRRGGVVAPRLQASTWADRLVPVKLPNGQARLWQADIEPYRSDIQLDPVRSPNALGQYEADGRTYSSRHSTAPMRRQ